MKYYVVRDNVDSSKAVVVGAAGKAPKEFFFETTKMVYEDQDCMKIVEGANGMMAIVDPDLVRYKLKKIELDRTKTKQGWNESSILKRIKSGILGGRS